MKDYFDSNRDMLGEILRDFRKENGYTQKYIADYLGIDRTTYSKYEAARKPELDVIIQLAAFYGVSVDEFLGRYTDEIVSGKNLKLHIKASSPEQKNGNGLTSDEIKLISLFRKSIRKTDILSYARKIVAEDSKTSDKK